MANHQEEPKFCSSVLTLNKLFEISNIKVGRHTIRNILKKNPEYPGLNLNSLIDVLFYFKIDNQVFKGIVETLMDENIFFPLIVLVNYSEHMSEYCIITTITNSTIHYYSPTRGEIKESIDNFTKIWDGTLIFIEISNETNDVVASIEQNFDEEIEGLDYLNSINQEDDFLSEDKCKDIINYCENKILFNRSKVDFAVVSTNTVSDLRTSSSALIVEKDMNVFQELLENISKDLGVSKESIETIQCVKYEVDQEFKVHFDANNINDRYYTVLVYLNEDFLGGATYFPEIDFKIFPKTGRKLFFKNRNSEEKISLYSSHAGLPVVSGVKYACNIWIKKPR